MKVFDLTRGKYPQLYYGNDIISQYEDQFKMTIHASYSFQRKFPKRGCLHDVEALIDTIPIFLVETSMTNEYVAVPGMQCSILVPEDRYYVPTEYSEFDIDEWVNTKESEKEDDPRERQPQSLSILDLLGVYIFTNDDDLIPRRIFVWMDKIMDYAKDHTKKGIKQIGSNAATLFDFVVFHEIGHALMDVELYGIHPSPHFSYSSDYVYRFIEEAYANGIALSIVYDNLKSQEQDFIKDFVLSQGAGYARGWDLRDYHLEIDQWLSIKVLFNYDIACLIRDCWKNNHQELVPECVQSVGHNDWLALKDRHDKWGIIELPSQKDIIGFKKYDSFWSFDENGLCMVRLDQQKGYLYGFVNEQGVEQIPVEYDHLYSFENGITIAKKDGRYGAIDLNNNTVIPFNLPYEDIRGFRNGRASVKDRNEKWGVIDTNGKLIVPCENNNIVL